MQTTEFIWFDGKLVPWDSAKVQRTTHSLHYGSAIFEVHYAPYACARMADRSTGLTAGSLLQNAWSIRAKNDSRAAAAPIQLKSLKKPVLRPCRPTTKAPPKVRYQAAFICWLW